MKKFFWSILAVVAMVVTGCAVADEDYGFADDDDDDQADGDGEDDADEDIPVYPKLIKSGPGYAGPLAPKVAQEARLAIGSGSVGGAASRKRVSDIEGLDEVKPAFGQTFFFQPPFYSRDYSSCAYFATIYSLSQSGEQTEFFKFGEESCGLGMGNRITFNGEDLNELVGYDQSSVVLPDGSMIYGNNFLRQVFRFLPDGTRTVLLDDLVGVVDLIYHNGFVYASVAQSTDGDYARIVQIDPDSGEFRNYHIFSEEVLVIYGFGNMNHTFLGASMGLAFDEADNLYVAINHMDKIYVIPPETPDYEEEVFLDDVFGPFDLEYRDGYLYFTTMPKLDLAASDMADVLAESIALKAVAVEDPSNILTIFNMPMAHDCPGFIWPGSKDLTQVNFSFLEGEKHPIVAISDSSTGKLSFFELKHAPECDPSVVDPCLSEFPPELPAEADGDEEVADVDGDEESEVIEAEPYVPVYDGTCLADTTGVSSLGGYCHLNCWQEGVPNKALCLRSQVCVPINYGLGGQAVCQYPCYIDAHCAVGETCTTEEHPWGPGICLGPEPDLTDGDEEFTEDEESESEPLDGDEEVTEDEAEPAVDGDDEEI